MSKETHPRNYYISNQNMSDIKQSIDEYSMTFEKQSGFHGNSKSRSEIPSQIQQVISGSHVNNPNKSFQKSKSNVQPKLTIEQLSGGQNISDGKTQEQKQRKPVNLGEQVFETIKERYYQTNKIATEDTGVLFDFYLVQRKQRNMMKQIKNQDIEKQMPSMQRKLLIKRQFQKILTYYPQDVFYTLSCSEERLKIDRSIQQKAQYQTRQFERQQQQKKQTKKKINKTSQKLYNPKGKIIKKQIQLTEQQKDKQKRNQFGKNLSQHFQKVYSQKGHPFNIETIQKLHQFWQESYQRQQFGIEWEQDNVQVTIQQYMYEQIQDLMVYAQKKKLGAGFKGGKASSLYMVYLENIDKIKDINIPIKSYEQYVKVYNSVEQRKIDAQKARTESLQAKQKAQEKKNEIKKFGRPVSATPISILAKPKTKISQLEDLATKYPQDKLLKTLVTHQHLKLPRYPFEYGIYNIEQEVKTKQWVKIDPKLKNIRYQQTINDKLIHTFSNPQFSLCQTHDQVIAILDESNLEKEETWKELGPVLHQAMLVKAYKDEWFRECMLKYLEKTVGTKEDNSVQTNQVVFKKVFRYLNSLNEQKKNYEFGNLQNLIQASQKIAENTKKIQSLTKQPNKKNNQVKERRLLDTMLEQKAIQYVKMRIRKTNQKFTLRSYLKQLFQQCMKQHKDYIKKNFNVVEGDRQCPKLFKYQFFRLVKQINPITLLREKNLKNHAWVPPKQTPQNFNYKTHNLFAEFYTKDHNIIAAKAELPQKSKSLWGRKKGKDRENLMMTYQDAHQCTFQPRISTKII